MQICLREGLNNFSPLFPAKGASLLLQFLAASQLAYLVASNGARFPVLFNSIRLLSFAMSMSSLARILAVQSDPGVPALPVHRYQDRRSIRAISVGKA